MDWYHVLANGKCFGFAAQDGVIKVHPLYEWQGRTLTDYKPTLIAIKAVVTKVN